MTARQQCIKMIGEEFTKKWETLPPELKMVMAEITKTDFTKQTSYIHTFKVGSSHQKRKSRIRNNTLSSKHRLPTYSFNQRVLQTLKMPARDQSNTQPINLSKATNRILQPTNNPKADKVPISPLRVFVSRSNSSNSSKIRLLEDLPSNLEVQLIHILLMSPQ